MTNKDHSPRVLVLADVWCQIESFCDQVKAELDDPGAEVLVVAPVLVGLVNSFYGDIDHERAVAERRLSDILQGLKLRGIEARGEIGDEDPSHAVSDAINGITPDRSFPPDEIILITHDHAHENWREHNLAARLQAYGAPVRHLVVEHDTEA